MKRTNVRDIKSSFLLHVQIMKKVFFYSHCLSPLLFSLFDYALKGREEKVLLCFISQREREREPPTHTHTRSSSCKKGSEREKSDIYPYEPIMFMRSFSNYQFQHNFIAHVKHTSLSCIEMPHRCERAREGTFSILRSHQHNSNANNNLRSSSLLTFYWHISISSLSLTHFTLSLGYGHTKNTHTHIHTQHLSLQPSHSYTLQPLSFSFSFSLARRADFSRIFCVSERPKLSLARKSSTARSQ